MTEQARLAQKAKRAAAKSPADNRAEKTKAKPAIIRTVAAMGDMSLATEFAGTPRSEFLTVAAGAVETVRLEMQGRLPVGAKPVTWTQAVDAILAEADRQWPR